MKSNFLKSAVYQQAGLTIYVSLNWCLVVVEGTCGEIRWAALYTGMYVWESARACMQCVRVRRSVAILRESGWRGRRGCVAVIGVCNLYCHRLPLTSSPERLFSADFFKICSCLDARKRGGKLALLKTSLVCVCVCVWERERNRETEREWEAWCLCVCVSVTVSVCACGVGGCGYGCWVCVCISVRTFLTLGVGRRACLRMCTHRSRCTCMQIEDSRLSHARIHTDLSSCIQMLGNKTILPPNWKLYHNEAG